MAIPYIPPDMQALINASRRLQAGQPIDDPRGTVAAADRLGVGASEGRARAMEELGQQSTDPFSAMIREASLATIRRERAGSRRQSFVTGPRGLEGPMSNLIFGGGTSLMGS